MKYHPIETVEQYMMRHQFLEADKIKIRNFLRAARAVDGYLTRHELHFVDKSGVSGVISRSLLGIQNNFV